MQSRLCWKMLCNAYCAKQELNSLDDTFFANNPSALSRKKSKSPENAFPKPTISKKNAISCAKSDLYTPFKISMEPKNKGLEDLFFFFEGLLFRFHVGFHGHPYFQENPHVTQRLL